MDADQVAISNLVRLPITFHELGDKSIVDLVKKYGLKEQMSLGTISPSAIASHLELDHSLIDVWLNWSSDKRTSSGAYFYRKERSANDDAYVVGVYPDNATPELEYEAPIDACAEFIFVELKSWLD